MTALSETQKELGSYFKCLDEEKYMMTIPPLQPKPTEENPLPAGVSGEAEWLVGTVGLEKAYFSFEAEWFFRLGLEF